MADAARLADCALCRPVSLLRAAGAVHARGGADRARTRGSVRQLGSDLWRAAGGADPGRGVRSLSRGGAGSRARRDLAGRTQAGVKAAFSDQHAAFLRLSLDPLQFRERRRPSPHEAVGVFGAEADVLVMATHVLKLG